MKISNYVKLSFLGIVILDNISFYLNSTALVKIMESGCHFNGMAAFVMHW